MSHLSVSGLSAKLKTAILVAGIVVCAGVLLLVSWTDMSDGVNAEWAFWESEKSRPAPPATLQDSGALAAVPTAIATAPAAAESILAPGSNPAKKTPAPSNPSEGLVAEQPGSPARSAVDRTGASRDGGTSQPPLSRVSAVVPRRADRSRDAGIAPDAGTSARAEGHHSPESSQSATLHYDGTGRRLRDDDVGRVRVARFVDSGGVDLVGRVVDVDTGRPLSGVPVEVRLEKRFVEIESSTDGTFRIPGMVPGSKVVVWIGDKRERVVPERVDLRVPSNGNNAELGVVSLLAGNELDPRLNGWIGIYVASKDGRIRVSAINAWVPAARAGIAVGDVVLSVNGRDVKGMGPRAVAFLLRGPTGRAVNLELESSDGTKRQVTVQRMLR